MVTAVLSEDSLSPPALVPSSRVVFVVVSSKFIGIARGGFGAVRPEARPPRGRRRAEDATRSSERRRSLELTATFRPGDSAADGAFFSIPLDDEEKPQFV